MSRNQLTGLKFGRLYVVSYSHTKNKKAYWVCHCDCGKQKILLGINVKRGLTTSCGCYASELKSIRSKTHGMSQSLTYKNWEVMKERCLNPKSIQYKDYGGRGIKVCERWLLFENFIIDMGERPTKNHSLDRVNNNKGYSLDNCRWATHKQQANNTRHNHFVLLDGQKMTVSELAEKFHIKYDTMLYRVNHKENFFPSLINLKTKGR